MVLVRKFRVFNPDTNYSTPWNDYKATCKSVEALKDVRKVLGSRMFVKPSDIDLSFVEVKQPLVNRRINLKAQGYNFDQ